MSIHETFSIIKWITIGFGIALVCCVIAAIVHAIPVFDHTYGDLLFITFFPRVLLAALILSLGEIWFTHRARVTTKDSEIVGTTRGIHYFFPRFGGKLFLPLYRNTPLNFRCQMLVKFCDQKCPPAKFEEGVR